MQSQAARSVPRKLGLAVLTVLLVLGLAEGCLQIARWLRPDAFRIDANVSADYTMPTDPRLLFRMPSGTSTNAGVETRINTMGWRGDEPAIEKPPGVYRLMLFGDSSTFGFGVEEEEGLGPLTGAKLAATGSRVVEVLNAAVPGYSSTQCRILFEDNAERFGVDAIVLAPLWSDIIVRPWTDADLLRKFSSEGYRFESRMRKNLRRSAGFCLAETLHARVRGLPEDRMIAFHSVVNGDVQPTADGTPRVPVEQHRDNIRSMCAQASAGGMDVVLLLLHSDPTLFQWPPKRLTAYRKNYEDAAAEFGCPLVDVSAVFPTDPEPLSALFIDGIHPTAEGHALIAAELFEALREAPGFRETRTDR